MLDIIINFVLDIPDLAAMHIKNSALTTEYDGLNLNEGHMFICLPDNTIHGSIYFSRDGILDVTLK